MSEQQFVQALPSKTFDPNDIDSLREAVRRYVRSHRTRFLHGPQRRDNLERSVARSHARAVEAWRNVSVDQREEAASFLTRTVADIEFVLGHVLLFALLPRNTITRRFAGLGQATELPARRWPVLSGPEVDALRVAPHEMKWSGPEVLELQGAACLEKAKGGVRRFTLTSPEEWYAFAERQP